MCDAPFSGLSVQLQVLFFLGVIFASTCPRSLVSFLHCMKRLFAFGIYMFQEIFLFNSVLSTFSSGSGLHDLDGAPLLHSTKAAKVFVSFPFPPDCSHTKPFYAYISRSFLFHTSLGPLFYASPAFSWATFLYRWNRVGLGPNTLRDLSPASNPPSPYSPSPSVVGPKDFFSYVFLLRSCVPVKPLSPVVPSEFVLF